MMTPEEEHMATELLNARTAYYDAHKRAHEARMAYYSLLINVDSEFAASVMVEMADEWIDAVTYEDD